MSSASKNADPIGLSAIDLLCCAFVAIFILNTQLDDTPGESSPDRAQATPVQAVYVDLDARLPRPPALGVRLNLGGNLMASTDPAPPAEVSWVTMPYKVVAFVRREVPPGSLVEVFALDAPDDGSIRVRVSGAAGQGQEGELRFSEFYRARFSWP